MAFTDSMPQPGQPHLSRDLSLRRTPRRSAGLQDAAIVAGLLRDFQRPGNFREDLFYRLNVIPFFVPPLRDRPEDIPQLADHFLREFTTAYGRKPKELTPEAYRVLVEHHWPGNVRELKNLIERIVILNPQVRVDARHIPIQPARRQPSHSLMRACRMTSNS
jgi:two-component system nitrogen regulation response regulator NtrX